MTVLVTRPDERGQQLADELNRAGIVALHSPLLKISPGSQLTQLPSQLSQLKPGDMVFAVSKNAVDFAAQTLRDIGFAWRNDLLYLAVGHRTALHFTEQTQQSVHYPLVTENSEGLLALSEMTDLTDKNILVLRGNGGREYFSEVARQRGATVELLECYQRQNTELDPVETARLWQRCGVNILLVTSMQSLQALLELIPREEQQWLLDCCLVTVSERIAALARSYGFQQVEVAQGADNANLFTKLTELTSLP